MKIYGDELQKNSQLIDRHTDISCKRQNNTEERLEDEQKPQDETLEFQDNPEDKKKSDEITE